jgi:hypothetical protein
VTLRLTEVDGKTSTQVQVVRKCTSNTTAAISEICTKSLVLSYCSSFATSSAFFITRKMFPLMILPMSSAL